MLWTQLVEHPTAILAEHCDLWEAQTGVRVSITTMSRAIRRLKWSRKRTVDAAEQATATALPTSTSTAIPAIELPHAILLLGQGAGTSAVDDVPTGNFGAAGGRRYGSLGTSPLWPSLYNTFVENADREDFLLRKSILQGAVLR